jgi:PAP2 superfamily
MKVALRYWLVGFQALFVVTLALVSSHPIPFEFSRPMGAAMMIWSVGILFLIARTMFAAFRADNPNEAFFEGIKSEIGTIRAALIYAVLLGLSIALHGWGKSMIPHVTSYWADPYLANLDAAIFGQDPWHLFRSDLFRPLYSQAYVSWFLITFGTMGFLAFSKRDHSAILTSYLAILIIGGTVGQYLLPSAGPIFYERVGHGARFAELVATNDPTYGLFADYLWKHYQAGGANLGTGISAMPSMHVTLAVWTVIAARALWRPLMVPAIIYALVIWAASIASGWHYALDGIVGAALAIGVVRLLTRRSEADAMPAVELETLEPEPAPAA